MLHDGGAAMPAPPTRRFARRWRTALIVAFVLGLLPGSPASAFETQARQALLVDMNTQSVLLQKNANELMPPASMSKMMTVHMVFERLREGRLKLSDKLPVSENAWRRGGAKSAGSTMFLNLGDSVSVEDLLRGIIIQSGNDACIVVAEGLSGSEEAFAAEMTRRAHELGLNNSTFTNATGWPDPGHLTTAHDLALLAKRTIEDFPQFYHYYAEKEFTYNNIRQGNRNPLLYKNLGSDGLKTGHTEASGYGITASAQRGDRRLIMVLNGLPSIKSRTQESERVMEWGFREFGNFALLKAGEIVADAEVWLGAEDSVPLTVERDLVVTLPLKARPNMMVSVNYDGPVAAPIKAGERLAVLRINAPGMDTMEYPLFAAADVEQLGLLGRLAVAFQHVVLSQIQ
jgi:D-alanyl-D-alanine carboxypeptidase (penicillin-binding protein 5/6)